MIKHHFYHRAGLAAFLLSNICGFAPAAQAGTSHPAFTQRSSHVDAQVEIEETTSAEVHLREYNGHYTLSAIYLEDKGNNFEFQRHSIKNKAITRREYLDIWNALNDIGFWQAPSLKPQGLVHQSDKTTGIIRIQAADNTRSHEAEEHMSQDGTWLGSYGKNGKPVALKYVANMILILVKRTAHTQRGTD